MQNNNNNSPQTQPMCNFLHFFFERPSKKNNVYTRQICRSGEAESKKILKNLHSFTELTTIDFFICVLHEGDVSEKEN
jgi:hypothetical protein